MLSIKKHIPNFITLLNLLSGSVGIVLLFKGYPLEGAMMIWIAALLDFFDGFAARWLKVTSSIGKELDSLADVVSFGLLPSMIMFYLFEKVGSSYWAYTGFMVVLFSALRLAKFNVDTKQSESFIGLPTPANAIMISAFPFISEQYDFFMLQKPEWLFLITLISSFLLVSNIHLFSLKFKGYKWSKNWVKYVFLIVSVLLLLFYSIVSLPIIIMLYILFSLFVNYFIDKQR